MTGESFSRPPSQSAYSSMPSSSSNNAFVSPNRAEKSKSLSNIPQSSFRRSTADDSEEVDENWRRADAQTMLSVAESMVSQNWFLPSLTASSNFDNTFSMQGSSMVVTDENLLWAEAESKRNFLRNIFQSDGSDLLGDELIQVEQPDREDDGNNRRRRKRDLGATNNNAALYQSSRNMLATPALSVSMGESRPGSSSSDGKIPRPQLSLPGVAASPSGQSSEKHFLFLNNLLIDENKALSESKSSGNGESNRKNPLLKLNKVKQHFKESPIALMNKKQQRESQQHPVRIKKKKNATSDANDEDTEHATGGFFFASLLGSSTKNAPNIGPTTFPRIDDEDMRSLFHSTPIAAASASITANQVTEIPQLVEPHQQPQQQQQPEQVMVAREADAPSLAPQLQESATVEPVAPYTSDTQESKAKDTIGTPFVEEKEPEQVVQAIFPLSLSETFPVGVQLTAYVIKIVASKLRNVELLGKNDPYILLNFNGGKWKGKTSVIDNGGSDVEWTFSDSDTAMRFVLSAEDLQTGILDAQAMDSNSFRKHVLIGSGEVALTDSEGTYESIDRGQGYLRKNISLTEKNGQFAGYLEIHLKLVRQG